MALHIRREGEFASHHKEKVYKVVTGLEETLRGIWGEDAGSGTNQSSVSLKNRLRLSQTKPAAPAGTS